MTRSSWVQDPATGKLIPKEEWHERPDSGPYVQGDIPEFTSPIDGSRITSRNQLREHHAHHGTTDARDYSPDYLRKRSNDRVQRAMGQTPADKADRIRRIRSALGDNL